MNIEIQNQRVSYIDQGRRAKGGNKGAERWLVQSGSKVQVPNMSYLENSKHV